MFLPCIAAERVGAGVVVVRAVVVGRVRVVDDRADALGVRARTTVYGSGLSVCFGFSVPVVGSIEMTPCVWPETRLSAPGVEGP